VVVPEIADYEVRRELLRAGRTTGVERLDALAVAIGLLPLTTAAMRKAAEFWAQARRAGRPTADDRALDADVILAAQATVLTEQGDAPVIATTNVGHLARFATAMRWEDIS
jgi:predicted nucleic acid-binding protein